jgi:hypothetical protein
MYVGVFLGMFKAKGWGNALGLWLFFPRHLINNYLIHYCTLYGVRPLIKVPCYRNGLAQSSIQLAKVTSFHPQPSLPK